jgi:hypothetical protein
MLNLKVRIPALDRDTEDQPAIPLSVPTMEEIRALAEALHRKGQPFDGEMWGWPVSYEPEDPTPPIDSRMTFTPASFTIGVFGVWFVSLTWERGRTAAPTVFLDAEVVTQPTPA